MNVTLVGLAVIVGSILGFFSVVADLLDIYAGEESSATENGGGAVTKPGVRSHVEAKSTYADSATVVGARRT